MIKENPTEVVGLKALAWDIEGMKFISPARPDFVWSPGGLQMSACSKCGNEPRENCTCGLYATFLLDVAMEYIHQSPISPIFLVEGSDVIHLYSEGFRASELTIHCVAPNADTPQAKLAASQASDYFQIPIATTENLMLLMDLTNKKNVVGYEFIYPETLEFLKAVKESEQ